MLVQKNCGEKSGGRVEVHGQLPAIDAGACKQGEESVESGHFVDDLEVSDDFGAGAKGHHLEEVLQSRVSTSVVVVCGRQNKVPRRTLGRGISRR